MLFLVPSVFLFYAAFYGVGFLASSLLRIGMRQGVSLTAFLGICFASLFFSIAQFFTPLNVVTLMIVLLTGMAGCALALKNGRGLAANVRQFMLLDLVLVLVISAYICSHEDVSASDTLGYHETVVSLLNFSRIIPGIANLHFRLGMNSAYLILAGGIDVGIFDKYSSSILPAVFFLLTLRYFLELTAERGLSKEGRLFSLILFMWTVLFACGWMLSPNLYYDIPAQMFTVISICEMLLRYHESKMIPGTSFRAIFIFAAMSFAIKQMGAVMVAFVFCAGAADIVRNRGRAKDFMTFISVPAVIGITYVIRNIIQTGYPLYPLPVLGIDVRWSARSVVWEIYDAIKYWARLPGAGYMRAKSEGFLFWFAPWIKTNLRGSMICFTSLLLALVLSVRVLFVSKIRGRKFAGFVPLMSVCVVNILFWFTSAPDFRFGSVFFFLPLAVACYFSGADKLTYIVLGVLAVNIVQVRELARGSANKVFLGNAGPWTDWLWCLIIGLSLCFVFLTAVKNRHIIAAQLLLLVICTPYSGDLRKKFPAAAESGPVRRITLNNGQVPPLEVYVPEAGDSLGDAPLPCTPYPNDKLRLIEPGNMKEGFYIDEKI